MPEGNSNDGEIFKQRTRAVFDLVATGYDNPAQRFFPFCADRMIHQLNLKPGEKVLDVATGTGMAAIAAAQRILPGGRVHAIDIAENMLAKAQFNCHKHGLDNVDFHTMDAEQLLFRSQYFDAISCAFGLFFLPDMSAAITQWSRVLKPAGRVIYSSFTQNAFSPYAELFRHGIESLGINFPSASWRRLSEPLECTQLLTTAGFRDAHAELIQMGYHLADEQQWWELLWNSGFRGVLTMLSPEQLARFRVQHLAAVAQHQTSDGLWLNVEVIFTHARKP
ncbi:MAG: class I SAM-dependent methyltransferase [Gammaproteobacteria bacterium]|nr:class I SAM-dependent methyltransferase [Gammaproteobacteria bacterium]